MHHGDLLRVRTLFALQEIEATIPRLFTSSIFYSSSAFAYLLLQLTGVIDTKK